MYEPEYEFEYWVSLLKEDDVDIEYDVMLQKPITVYCSGCQEDIIISEYELRIEMWDTDVESLSCKWCSGLMKDVRPMFILLEEKCKNLDYEVLAGKRNPRTWDYSLKSSWDASDRFKVKVPFNNGFIFGVVVLSALNRDMSEFATVLRERPVVDYTIHFFENETDADTIYETLQV